MGEPLFKVRQLVAQHNVRIFSSNYTLSGDLSRRVMEVLYRHCGDVEIYSIDEAFFGASVFTTWGKEIVLYSPVGEWHLYVRFS